MKENKQIKILLLTNRDSDNTGDQVIEASDMVLIEAAMSNLGYNKADYVIISKAAGIISQKYLKERKESQLESARKTVKDADIIIFGGAPLFNYAYQNFYERTAVTLELAQEYNKPVIFSAIGVEGYDEDSEKCQRLKATLNFPCVKQITTRDGYEELKKYKEREDLVIAKVADPAVFSAIAFRNFVKSKEENPKKKIGLFIFRANGFIDNKVDFTKEQSAKLWKSLIKEITSRGYDYELITSGHFGDEAFMDYLIREKGVKESKCVFNINYPELLIEKLSGFDGIISCRLHPSIIAFSLGVPSVGIIWNSKVKHFYESIGYSDRSVNVEEMQGMDSVEIVNKLEKAMEEGVVKDSNYLISVYETLFTGIKNSLEIKAPIEPWTYEELLEKMPAFGGTSEEEKLLKLKRKFRRSYSNFNERGETINRLKEEKKNTRNRYLSFISRVLK